MRSRKIAIIGAAVSENEIAAIKKLKGYELWGMNNVFIAFPDVTFTRWFELHHFTRIGNRYLRRGQSRYTELFRTIKEYLEAINDLGIPVYMQKPFAPVKKSVKFPFREIMRFFKTQYFGCSFAWMLAFALYEHLKGQRIETIALLGVDLLVHEYYYQRPSTEYWIGRAQGMGIQVQISNTCSLLKAPWIYAYKENFDCVNDLYVGVTQNLLTMASIPMQNLIEKTYYSKEKEKLWLPTLQ